MEFTTTTKIARNGKKEFEQGVKIVMCNNEDIGMIWGKDYYEFFKDGTLIEDLRQEMREAKNKDTTEMIKDYRAGKREDSVSFDNFIKSHDL